jgi:flagellar hook-associated protein FlgK
MSSATSIAASGIATATLGVAAAASNIANAGTPGYQPVRVDQAAQAGGGVSGQVSRPGDPLAEVRADRALLGGQGVDLVAEVVAQGQAARLVEANLKSLQAASDLEQDLLVALGR